MCGMKMSDGYGNDWSTHETVRLLRSVECPFMHCCVSLPVKLFSVGFRCKEVGLDSARATPLKATAVFLSDFLLLTANNGDIDRSVTSVSIPSAFLLTSRRWMSSVTVWPAQRHRKTRLRSRLNSIAICNIGRDTVPFGRSREIIT
jgi:hypothetical protein